MFTAPLHKAFNQTQIDNRTATSTYLLSALDLLVWEQQSAFTRLYVRQNIMCSGGECLQSLGWPLMADC